MGLGAALGKSKANTRTGRTGWTNPCAARGSTFRGWREVGHQVGHPRMPHSEQVHLRARGGAGARARIC